MSGDEEAGAARVVKAVYTLRGGLGGEVEATLPLRPGEKLVTQGAVRRYAGPFAQRPCFLRLTTDRLVLLEHFAVHSDRITDIPREALQSIDRVGCLVGFRARPSIALSWTQAHGALRAVRLIPKIAPLLVTENLAESAAQLFEELREWKTGGGEIPPAP